MRYIELLTEGTKISAPADLDGTRSVYVTKRFLKELPVALEYPGAKQSLQKFLEAKTTQPYATLIRTSANDRPFTGGVLSGVWHCHLVKGKIIIVYLFDDTHVELFTIGPHDAYEGKNVEMLHRYIESVGNGGETLSVYQWKSKAAPVVFDDDVFTDLEGIILTMAQNDDERQLLDEFVKKGAGIFYDFVEGLITAATADPRAPEEFNKAWTARYGKTIQAYVTTVLRSSQ